MPMENVPDCAGAEFEHLARVIRLSIQLAPHLGLPHIGCITPLRDIPAIETTRPFRDALARVLARLDEAKPADRRP